MKKIIKNQILRSAAVVMAAVMLGSCSDKSSDKNTSSLESKIDKLSASIEKLSTEINELKDQVAEPEFDSDIHSVYDDTAVIEAYKSGDDSNLKDEKDIYILNELKKAIDQIITEDMSDYDKEKAVYDYIFENTRFNEDSLNAINNVEEDNSSNPYGFFHDHQVICLGDATTFKLFMDALDIECNIIHSTENGEHAWDQVKIDGDWYHVDILFDYGITKPVYAFFNVPDSVKEMEDYPWEHSSESDIKCTSTKLCYICANAVKLDDIYELPEQIYDLLNGNENAAYFYIDVPDGADALSVQQQIKSIMDTMVTQYNDTIPLSAIADEDGSRVCFGIGKYDTESEEQEPDYSDPKESGIDIDYEKLEMEFEQNLGTLYNRYDFSDIEY